MRIELNVKTVMKYFQKLKDTRTLSYMEKH